MDEQVIANPYDFGSPIRDETKFADRSQEQDKIQEYLQLSDTEDPSYYHLALTGTRAAGKTSLLNRTEEMAQEMDFLPVKISLNYDIVSTDVRFFTEVLDLIMTDGTAEGMYGGRKRDISKIQKANRHSGTARLSSPVRVLRSAFDSPVLGGS